VDVAKGSLVVEEIRSHGGIHIGHDNGGAFFGEHERARASDSQGTTRYDR
jgi:hypothetical protein